MKKTEKIQGKKGRLGERVCRRLDIPCDVLPGGSLVTIRGRGQVTVGGGRHILEYTRERIRIELCGGEVEIIGEGLECISYCTGQISAEGVINSVSFKENGKERGKDR